ncbi:MAG: CPBP family glutamic-type intramembrane protease [candidate division WOR-3 bacterium]|nr:CPBP family glutamic-type intramembrane protease [candidate division WOR-3 bacterium]
MSIEVEFYNNIIKEIIPYHEITPWQAFVFVGLTGPIIEEMVFRGLLLNGYLKRYSVGTAVLLSSLLFALAHSNLFLMIP